MNKITVETPYGNTLEFYHYQGTYYPAKWLETMPGKDMQHHLESVKNMTIRDEDVFLATYPKAGTNWAWEIIMMLKKGSVNYETKPKAYMFLELRSPNQLAEVPSPRVLNSHYPVKHLPQGLFEKKTKIIHVQRNPKSVFVSFYHFAKGFNSPESESFSRFLPLLMGTYGIYHGYPWFKYVKEWERFTKENPDQILNLYYEDMKEDLVREITKINEFLQCGRSDEMIEQIAEACSFQNMKKANIEVKDHSDIGPKSMQQKKQSGAVKMYRKGEVGDWKNHFTVAENEKMNAWLKDNLVDTDLKFRYEL